MLEKELQIYYQVHAYKYKICFEKLD